MSGTTGTGLRGSSSESTGGAAELFTPNLTLGENSTGLWTDTRCGEVEGSTARLGGDTGRMENDGSVLVVVFCAKREASQAGPPAAAASLARLQ